MLLGLVAATACFEEPSSAPATPVDDTSTGAPSTSGAPTTANQDDSSAGATSEAGSSGEDDDTGSGEEGSTSTGESCTDDCAPARECLLAHADTSVSLLSIHPDGSVELLDQLDLGPHGSGLDAPLDQSIVQCGGQVFVATDGNDQIATLAFMGDGLSISASTVSADVLELACDEEQALLFALRTIDNGYAVDLMSVRGGPVLVESAEFVNPAINEFRTVRLALDRGLGRAWVAHVEQSANTTPVVLAVGSYTDDSIAFNAPEPLPVVNGNLSRLHLQPEQGRLLGLGTLVGGDDALFTVPIDETGAPGPLAFDAESPWAERRNLWPVRLSSEPGLAMGGTQGVVLATFSKDGMPQTMGIPIAPTLSDTLARPAFGGEMLVVVSPNGVATFDIGSSDGDPLDSTGESVGSTLYGAAVVACR